MWFKLQPALSALGAGTIAQTTFVCEPISVSHSRSLQTSEFIGSLPCHSHIRFTALL